MKKIDLSGLESVISAKYTDDFMSCLELSKWVREVYGVNICEDTLCGRLKSWGVARRGPETRRHSSLNSVHYSILQGLMLGDGGIYMPHTAKHAHLQLSTIHESYANELVSSLPLNFKYPLQLIPNHDQMIMGHLCHAKDKWVVRSSRDLALTPLREKWYVNGVKIVPTDLILDPLTVTHWFYGDGSTVFRYNNTNVILSFYTNCFTLDECEFLKTQLNNIDSCMHFTVGNQKGPVIRASKPETIACVLEYMKPEFTSTAFAYKWKLPEKKNIL